ncbi:MAG: AsmA family protein [Endozoicomonas sp.]
MKSILKFLVTIVAGFAVIAVVAVILLPRLINPNDYRQQLTTLIQDKTGITVSFDGPIGWSVFPWLGIAMEDVSIQGSDNGALGTLGRAEVSVKLLPLLSKQIETQAVILHGLELKLVKSRDGKGNWEFGDNAEAKTGAPAGSDENTAPAPVTRSNDAMIIPELNIASVEFKGLMVSYEDKVTGKSYVINDASLITSAIIDNAPFDLTLQARMKSSDPDLALRTRLDTTLGVNLGTRTITLDNLKVSTRPDINNGEKLDIVGHLRFEQPDMKEPLQMSGELDVTEFNPARLLGQIKMPLPPMSDPKALNRLSFKSRFNSNGKSFNADTLDLTLDGFTIAGNVNVTDLEKQSIVFQFTGNDLNLDQYLPPAAEKKPEATEPEAKQPTAQAQEPPLIPEDALRPLNLKGSLSLNSLTAAKLRFDKPVVKLTAAGGRQEIKLDSDFYQGRIDVDSKLDVRKKAAPEVVASADLKGINLEALAEPIPAMKSIQGTVNADLNVTTRGLVQSALTRNLNGKVNFGINKGAFTEANFDKLVCEGIAQIRSKSLEKSDWDKVTHFQKLGGTFVIKNGVANNDDLTAALSNLNLKGDGNINLVEQSLDYHVGLNISGDRSPDSDPACQVNEDYVNVTWPVRCQGKLGEQSCGLDTERLADTIAELAKQEVKGRIQEEIEKQVDGPLKDVLKGFFN